MRDFHIDIDIVTNEIQNHLKVNLSFFFNHVFPNQMIQKKKLLTLGTI